MSGNNIHQNHRARIRETFRKAGVEGMPDHSLLELLLFYSIPRKDTNELAHRLIETFGSLRGVFDAPYERLLEVEGMGESSALLISMIPGICRRYAESSQARRINLSEPEAAAEYAVKKYLGCRKEVFYMLCLDALGNLLNCCKLSEGTPGSVLVDKRAMLETAFRNNADKVIFMHNHPNGIAAPSKEDLTVTSELAGLLAGVGIRLADHIIVAGNETVSLAQIPKFKTLFI
ncbi:MAG: DNA repair protein RadC [Clostridiaceae bacterium]|nr:DNA repair protein RadC [Clostridiaceae bacterium]